MKWPIIATLALLTDCGESVQGAPEPGDNIALPPNRVDDAVTCTLGHEVMHLALGEYHR